jgi:hypothetical protein
VVVHHILEVRRGRYVNSLRPTHARLRPVPLCCGCCGCLRTRYRGREHREANDESDR